MSELINIENSIEIKRDEVIDVFSSVDKLKPYIQVVQEQVQVETIDLETNKGRKAIAARAHQVSKIKSALTKIGKESITDLKNKVSMVNTGIKYVEESLSNLRDDTRKPLTEWEEEQKRIERERIEGIQKNIDRIHSIADLHGDETIDEISVLIEAVSNIDIAVGFDEFSGEAAKAIADAKSALTVALTEKAHKAEQEKRQQELLEKERALAIQARLNGVRMLPTEYMGKHSSDIVAGIEDVKNMKADKALFGNQLSEFYLAVETVINQLTMMHEQALTLESVTKAKPKPPAKTEISDEEQLELTMQEKAFHYEPMDFWPSDVDRAESEWLDRVCLKLEEAEAFISQHIKP